MKNLMIFYSFIISVINGSNIQDTPDVPSVLTGPLNKISDFNLNTYYSSSRPEQIRIKNEMMNELKKMGAVHVIDTLQPIDFEKTSRAANLIFKIEQLQSIKNASIPLIRVSLSVETDVQIKLSKNDCTCYIWSSNLFIEGDLSKNKEDTIISSFKELIAKFQTALKEQNKETPLKITFNVFD